MARGTCAQPVALCPVGLSPAVVTEFLFALARLRPPLIPRRLVLVTTRAGAHLARRRLLGRAGALARLRDDLGLDARAFALRPGDLHVVCGDDGRPLDDLRTSDESRSAGRLLGRLVRRVVAEEPGPLLASLAGGRKTLGALLVAALQLHGRPGDRLFHVLVDPRFENVEGFFFPPRRPVSVPTPDGLLSSRDARIELAEVPIVRLGALARELGVQTLDLEDAARVVEQGLETGVDPPRVELDLTGHRLRVGELDLRLEPRVAVLLGLYASLRAECASCRRTGAPGCELCHPEDREILDRVGLRRRIGRLYGRRLPAGLGALLERRTGTAHDRERLSRWLRENRSRLRRFLRDHGPGSLAAAFVEVRSGVVAPDRRGIVLPPQRIQVHLPAATLRGGDAGEERP